MQLQKKNRFVLKKTLFPNRFSLSKITNILKRVKPNFHTQTTLNFSAQIKPRWFLIIYHFYVCRDFS